MSLTKKLIPLAVSAAIATPMLMTATSAQAELSGNIGVHSKYLLRGIGEENTGAAVQGGLDYSEGMFYGGWWASSLSYTYENPANDKTDKTGFENNLYGGVIGEIGGVSWDVGLIQYLYVNVDDSDLTELKVAVGLGDFTGQMQYLLNDGLWGNAGDIYWTLGYETEIPKGFTLGASLGYYTYDDDDNSELCIGAGLAAGCDVTTKKSNFRHLNLTLSHPVGNTGADMYVQYTKAGKDRSNVKHDDSMVLGITYGFDIK